MVVLIKVSKSLCVFVVEFESYWNVTPSIINVVSGLTITGVTDATLNFPKSVTNCVFSVSVRFCPVVFLIDMKTLPYSGTEVIPVAGSYPPSSPPQTETACVFGNNFLVYVI